MHPVEGTTLERGDRVTLVPSLGPPPVPVPNLVGLPLADAKGALREAHLKVGEVTRAFNERFDAEHVVRQSVGADADAPLGSRIDLVVSKGPTPVPVEKVIGLQQGRRSPSSSPRGSSSTCRRSSPTGSTRAP